LSSSGSNAVLRSKTAKSVILYVMTAKNNLQQDLNPVHTGWPVKIRAPFASNKTFCDRTIFKNLIKVKQYYSNIQSKIIQILNTFQKKIFE
jgi:hypothetical protein